MTVLIRGCCLAACPSNYVSIAVNKITTNTVFIYVYGIAFFAAPPPHPPPLPPQKKNLRALKHFFVLDFIFSA